MQPNPLCWTPSNEDVFVPRFFGSSVVNGVGSTEDCSSDLQRSSQRIEKVRVCGLKYRHVSHHSSPRLHYCM